MEGARHCLESGLAPPLPSAIRGDATIPSNSAGSAFRSVNPQQAPLTRCLASTGAQKHKFSARSARAEGRRRRKKAARGRLSNSQLALARSAFPNYFDAAEAAAMAAVAAPMALVAAPEAASATPEAAAAVEDAASATDEAAAATDEAAEAAASAAGAAVSVLVQAARAATATREANRSDLFMNFLEEKFWFEPLPVIELPALTADNPSKDSRPSSSISCA